jgi:hypothetical protein
MGRRKKKSGFDVAFTTMAAVQLYKPRIQDRSVLYESDRTVGLYQEIVVQIIAFMGGEET